MIHDFLEFLEAVVGSHKWVVHDHIQYYSVFCV